MVYGTTTNWSDAYSKVRKYVGGFSLLTMFFCRKSRYRLHHYTWYHRWRKRNHNNQWKKNTQNKGCQMEK